MGRQGYCGPDEWDHRAVVTALHDLPCCTSPLASHRGEIVLREEKIGAKMACPFSAHPSLCSTSPLALDNIAHMVESVIS